MIENILREAGFTSGESKVYLSLLKIGESSAKGIIKDSSLQNSVVHLCLNNLIKKGFVTYVYDSQKKIYSAVSPKEILRNLEFKKNKFEKALPEL